MGLHTGSSKSESLPVADTMEEDNGCLPRTKRAALSVWKFACEQWFMLGLGVAIAFAAAVPRLGASGGWIRAEYSIKIPAIIIIFIISGIGLKTKVLLTALADLRIHVLVQALSLGVIPCIGYGIGKSLMSNGFNQWLASGIVIMAAMPTTVSTNVVFTQRAAGNEAAALINAVIGNIIGIFITPLWLGVFLNVEGQAPYAKVLTDMAYQVLAPLVFGQILQYAAPKQVSSASTIFLLQPYRIHSRPCRCSTCSHSSSRRSSRHS
jgi:sodium/bile acid cotransporter 7